MENNEGRYVIMINKIIKKPTTLKNVFAEEDFEIIKNYLFNKPKEKSQFDPGFERYCFTDPIIDKYSEKLIPIARKLFESDNLLPTYSLFAHYEGNNPSLYRHKDDNACTYTIDMCVYQTEPWALGINHDGIDREYILQENEALVYYGNDQEHWRGQFPNPETNHVAMIFFHFAEPDHWWFTKGLSYLEVVRGQITEEQWELQNGNK
jgi:hypothetical protein